MPRQVSYAQQTHDSPNPLTRFAHRSRYRLSLELADRLLPVGGTLLDFGAGEGSFLKQLHERQPNAKLWAVEPYMTIDAPQVKRFDAIADVPDRSVDVVGTFEVLEHVTDAELTEFLNGALRVLKPGGRLLVTVPIMYGAALPVKEVSRALLHRRWGDTGPIEIARGTLGMPVARTPNRRTSHKGFDFRELRSAIEARFTLAEHGYSPFRGLPWWLNSQAVFIAT